MSEYAFGILNWLGNRTYQSVHIFLAFTIIFIKFAVRSLRE